MNGDLLLRRDDVGVDQHVIALRHVLAQLRFWIRDQPVGQLADARQRVRFDQHPIVRHHIWIFERQRERFTRLCPERASRVREIPCRGEFQLRVAGRFLAQGFGIVLPSRARSMESGWAARILSDDR